MAYEVFALKWRPKSFDEIIGQPHVVETLKNAILKKRLANAYLFAGPRGVGKTSAARIFAKALNCAQGTSPEPCGSCPACTEIAQGRSLDVIEIDGASNRGIDEIRTLRENVKFAPTAGKFKIYIIDEVHQITTDGFNALLKTLEEPPPYVKFIFATTHPHKILPTILSRCQRLDFRRISATEIVRQLERIAAAEKVRVAQEVLFAIARASDGSLRDAESILDQLVSFSSEEIVLKDVISVLGVVEQEALFELTGCVANRDAKAALSLADTVIDEGKDPAAFLNLLIEHFRNLMVAKICAADTHLIDLPQEVCERLVSQAEQFSLDEIFNAYSLLIATVEQAKRMDSVRIPLEITLARLCFERKGAAAAALPARPLPAEGGKPATKHPARHQERQSGETPAHRPQSRQEPKAEASSSAAAVRAPVTAATAEAEPQEGASVLLEDVQERWDRIVADVSNLRMSVGTYLSEGRPMSVERVTVTVAFPLSCSLHKESLEERAVRDLIEKVARQALQAPVKFRFTLADLEPQQPNHPTVRSALDMFDGRVVH